MANMARFHGSLIAFEGPRDTISTQCRLLPSSPNILVLPELEQFMKEGPNDSPSNPASYILRVHEACNARAESAYAFLNKSGPNKRRLVFMNGGTAYARMRCITTIAEHNAKGHDHTSAERLFNELTKDGVQGLYNASEATPDAYSNLTTNESELSRDEDKDHQDHGPLDNPICEAMRAADALDRATESLQLITRFDLAIPALRRSRSLPSRLFCGIPDTPSSGFSRASEDEVDDSCPSDCSDEVYNRSCAPPTYDSLTPRSISFESAPTTPVIIGEACLIDMRPLHSRFSFSRGLKSVDYLYASTILNQDISLCDIHRSDPSKLAAENRDMLTSQRKRVSRSKELSSFKRASLKTSKSTGRRGPPSPIILTRSNRRVSSYAQRPASGRNDYVNHGIYTENNHVDKGSSTDTYETSPTSRDRYATSSDTGFQPILPMQEDMVIHLKGEQPDLLLERILEVMKEPPPAIAPPRDPEPEPEDEIAPEISEPSASRQPTSRQGSTRREEADTGTGGSESTCQQSHADDYDPFASHGDYLQSCAIRPARKSPSPQTQVFNSRAQPSVPLTRTYTPPTPPPPKQPAPLPPPPQPAPRQTNRFYELNITNCRTAVEIQDSLRSALCTYFLSGDAPCRQHELSSISEIGGDWQPVFGKRRTSGGGGEGGRALKREVDLILAIGAQEGVDKEFSAALRGSLEKLGTKPTGITRSGRLDLRYLIVHAQRAVPDQHSLLGHNNNAPDNVPMHPRLLATLVIPFLETYMAVHSEMGFLLLEYPPEHLATVLAMQDLIGGDLLQVAGIVDLDDKADDVLGLGLTTTSCVTTSNRESEMIQKTSTSPSPGLQNIKKAGPSFSKASFVLTSSATESEIATLIAAIWKILVDRSPFYIPDGAPGRTLETDLLTTHNSQQQQKSTTYDSNSVQLFVHSPLINNSDMQYTPLDSAAAMMGFQGPAAATAITPTPTTYGTLYEEEEEEEKPSANSKIPMSTVANDASDSLLTAADTMTTTTTTTTTTATAKANNSSSTNRNNRNKNNNSSSRRTAKATTALRRQKKARKLRSLLGRNPEADAATNTTNSDGNGSSSSIRLPRLNTGSFLSVHLSDDNDEEEDDEDENSNEEEDRFAADERRYMPLFMRRNQHNLEALKGNSRKALRFLGLSTET